MISVLFYKAPEDYMTLVQNMTFDSSTNSIKLSIPLVDDNINEEDKVFLGNLSNSTAPEHVTLDPAQAHVTIKDNDRKCYLMKRFLA